MGRFITSILRRTLKTYTKYNNNVIPKKIFQTYECSYEELPKWFKKTSESWINLNPGWHYIYHDEVQRTRYVKHNSPELYKTYEAVKNIHKADIWRYLILRNEGGVYADMDSFCTVPMDYILEGLPDHIDVVSTEIENLNHVNNANFGAVIDSIVLNECIENIKCKNKDATDFPNQEVIHDCFSKNVLRNPDIVSKSMRAEHGSTFKRDFDQNVKKIDYYGQEMTYLEFLSNRNML